MRRCAERVSVDKEAALVREIDNFDKWFESTSSISWNLKWGDRYWYIDYWGNVNYRNYADAIIDRLNIDNGNVYYTEEECKKAHERKLAEVRLRKTSTFEPDFENGDGVYGKSYRLVAIEMKRKKGGVTSANQKQWIKTLNEAGIQTVVCKGCDAAIEFIESITKP